MNTDLVSKYRNSINRIDKNRNQILEGDIVVWDKRPYTHGRYIVIYDYITSSYKAVAALYTCSHTELEIDCNCEVIGNRYDNENLLHTKSYIWTDNMKFESLILEVDKTYTYNSFNAKHTGWFIRPDHDIKTACSSYTSSQYNVLLEINSYGSHARYRMHNFRVIRIVPISEYVGEYIDNVLYTIHDLEDNHESYIKHDDKNNIIYRKYKYGEIFYYYDDNKLIYSEHFSPAQYVIHKEEPVWVNSSKMYNQYYDNKGSMTHRKDKEDNITFSVSVTN